MHDQVTELRLRNLLKSDCPKHIVEVNKMMEQKINSFFMLFAFTLNHDRDYEADCQQSRSPECEKVHHNNPFSLKNNRVAAFRRYCLVDKWPFVTS